MCWVLNEEKHRSDTDRGKHPSLRPAFRVRRGWFVKCVDMTGYDGPRASGYPPDLVPFRRCAGACLRHRPLGRSRPPALLGALFGKVPRSARVAHQRSDVCSRVSIRPDVKQRRRARPDDMLDSIARPSTTILFATSPIIQFTPQIRRSLVYRRI